MRQAYIATLGLAFAATACAVSTQQEVQMGQQYSGEIAKQLPLVTDARVVGYVTDLGNSLAALVDSRGLEWKFHVVNAPEINAFAVPGGFIYVNRGLIERAQTMNQLAGVLGHEIGHVTRRHSVEQMRKAQGANVGVVLLCTLTSTCESQVGQAAVNVGGSLAFAKFSRDDERQADAEGVKNLVAAKINPNGIPEMFQILLEARKSSPGTLDAMFATHPLEEERVANARRMIAAYDSASVRAMRRDDAAFQEFKRRVQALPAPPPPAKK
ncbi:MAG TPA: M48 family metallopeptidase [Gemmatimonadaceae bacterium]|nr:M48 family metallopeptidase [Gemmatimonadaceae bacterium]